MIIKYVLILGIGHLLGDFYFLKEKTVKIKEEKYKGVLLHSLIYYVAVLLTILPVLSLDMILVATYTASVHFIVETVEYALLVKKKIRKNSRNFMYRQCVHIISLLMMAYIMDCWNFSIGHIEILNRILNAYGYDAIILARWTMAILFIHVPANVFIQNFLQDYRIKGDETIVKADNKAGRRIGTVERLIMLILLSMDQYAAMGFVLTAKSIARYDKIAKDAKFAEYYLLGTLVSTLCVIICRILILA